MDWTTPTLVEICVGLEINGYLPAEFWSRRISVEIARRPQCRRALY